MSRRYTKLRKKLRELETGVVELLTLPPESPHRHSLSDGVEERLDSLKALLSSEMSSSSDVNPDHLLQIAEILSELDIAFRCAAATGDGHECSSPSGGGSNAGQIDMADLGFKVYDVPEELTDDYAGEESKGKEEDYEERRRDWPSINGVKEEGGEERQRDWRLINGVKEEGDEGWRRDGRLIHAVKEEGDEERRRIFAAVNGIKEESAMVWTHTGNNIYKVWGTGVVIGAFSMAVFMTKFSACFYVIDFLGPLTPT
ncbi:unnamed protein product [Cuscuta epithymum]|uniref:DUF7610 domain-containing protein n=1 Tax=Cuscuta epithymum TaxID=186058 RepID=A0AAV0D1I3_9ASTE|nr:unnamed protein product [Cuscuta epithymum]